MAKKHAATVTTDVGTTTVHAPVVPDPEIVARRARRNAMQMDTHTGPTPGPLNSAAVEEDDDG